MKKIKKGDPVIVIAGKHKGSVSSVERVVEDFVYLKDVNVVKKAKKKEGFVKKTLPLHVSNVAYYLQDQKSPTKIGVEITAKGKKVRIAKKTGQKIS
ncbi:MAG: 50S ribosomal protein L24 [Candidatus Peribacteria bacterium]|jgi:large subunit ribosomal protein L24|nr:50S ribosomal protein L24 [Candidatus Peribacteria bacterium]